MESTAIWAVCQYRGTATATVHELGDVLVTDEWIPETPAERGRQEMLDPTIVGIDTFLAETERCCSSRYRGTTFRNQRSRGCDCRRPRTVDPSVLHSVRMLRIISSTKH